MPMKACPWNGEPCGECEGWPYPIDGRMPQRCEEKTRFEMSSLYLNQMSPERQTYYKQWVKNGCPRLHTDEDGPEDQAIGSGEGE
jgi:hypothetical protein